MTVILPQQAPSAAGWNVREFRSVSGSSSPAAGGVATVALDQLEPNELWLIDHAVITCTSLTPTAVRLYDTAVGPANLLDGSASGNFDVADWPAGLQIQPTRFLVVRWTGASAGAIGTVSLQVRSLRK